MAWCEANGVHFLFGLAKNDRLIAEIKTELDQAAVQSRRTGKPARRFRPIRPDQYARRQFSCACAVPKFFRKYSSFLLISSRPSSARSSSDYPCRRRVW